MIIISFKLHGIIILLILDITNYNKIPNYYLL